MCCFGRDRQPNDNNGNCEEPLEENCVDADPADNSNLCYIDDADTTTFLRDLEGDVHCHGLAWSVDANDYTSQLKYNNFFYVSLYDHLYKRGYVENMVDSSAVPMCGCIEDMPPVSRADCTQIDADLTFTITYGDNGVEAVPRENDLQVDFNACQGVNPRTGENESNDLASHVYKLYLEGKITEATRNAIYETLVGYLEPDDNDNEAACAYAYETETGNTYCSDEECIFFGVDTQISEGQPDLAYGDSRVISVDKSDAIAGKSQALLKFPYLAIPPGAYVQSAELAFYTINNSGGTLNAYRMIQEWTEQSTWNTFGNYGVNTDDVEARSTRSFAHIPSTNNAYFYVDVSNDISAWLNGESNQGWVLTIDSSDGWDFDSAETSRGPKLSIKYSMTPPVTDSPLVPTSVPTDPIPCDGNESIFSDSVATQVRKKRPSTYYGSELSLTADKNSFDDEDQALIKFPGLVVPTGATVDSAHLRLKTINSSSGPIRGYRMIKPWTAEATWNYFDGNGVNLNNIEANPAESFVESNYLSASSPGIVFDVTSDVNAWLQGEDNQGWVLMNDSSDGWDFETSGGTIVPLLTVRYSCGVGNP